MTNPNEFFRLNVGFIVNQTIGYSREFQFASPNVHLDPDLDLEDLSGTARVTRTTQGLLLQGKMEASIRLECVRCLDSFSNRVGIEVTELYAFSPEDMTETGFLLPDDGRIDLAPLVREEMMLSIPIKPLCRPDCAGLCPVCGDNKNQVECNHNDAPIDPRLAGLEALLREKNR